MRFAKGKKYNVFTHGGKLYPNMEHLGSSEGVHSFKQPKIGNTVRIHDKNIKKVYDHARKKSIGKAGMRLMSREMKRTEGIRHYKVARRAGLPMDQAMKYAKAKMGKNGHKVTLHKGSPVIADIMPSAIGGGHVLHVFRGERKLHRKHYPSEAHARRAAKAFHPDKIRVGRAKKITKFGRHTDLVSKRREVKKDAQSLSQNVSIRESYEINPATGAKWWLVETSNNTCNKFPTFADAMAAAGSLALPDTDGDADVVPAMAAGGSY